MTKVTTIPKIYIRRTIPEKYLDKMIALGAELIIDPWQYGDPEPPISEDISNCNIVLTLGLTDSLSILQDAPNIQWVQSLSVGLDALLHEEVKNSEIIITNTKGCTSVPIAEHTIAMIAGLARGIPFMIRNQLHNRWAPTPITDLAGSTLGIIGYGEIGKQIAKRAKSLDMFVIGCKKRPSFLSDNAPADLIVGLDQIDDVITKSDFLILALPSTPDTYQLINQEKLAKMKENSFLINIGRGNTIVEEELIHLLKEKKIAGAALDVFEVEPLPKEHPLWELENIIISPHNAFFSPNTIDRYMEVFLENIQRFKDGKELINVVDKQLGY
ncbi:D-2-hydroxyacid dehydrogenase [Niallia sp.]|uniref:D-2-hydroxyacid dehydrogenase n=1 Tax=Niallia sp. TaxID=2837523 RepID=UPI00289734DF|nr:D-2-hydroxyacid dehydrogenase [Niallia sp.]